MPGFDRISCKLYLGTKPNPSQIVIRKFAQMDPGINYEIHIPDIYNPTSVKELILVNVRVETTITATASPSKHPSSPFKDV